MELKDVFDVTAWTDQALTDRYVEEMVKLKKINRWSLEGKKRHPDPCPYPKSLEEAYGPRPCGYPDTAMMNACKRELVRRGLLVPRASLPEE